jgi:uncharacterized phage protein gp47/JayE
MSLGNDFGLLSTGFVQKQIDDLLSDLEGDIQLAFGASVDTSNTSRFGQIIGIVAERLLEVWNLAAAVYTAFDPNQAIGTSLQDLSALTGTQPIIPTPSIATVTCTGTPGTSLVVGELVAVVVTGSVFVSTEAGTITSVTAWATNQSHVQADRVTANGKVWQLTNASGTTASSGGGPTGAQGASVTDNTCTWLCLGTGTGAADLVFDSQDTGAIVATNGTLTQIQTPVSGWSSAYNVSAAVLGISAESTAALRIRRVAELHGPGRSTVGAIQAAILNVAGVTNCTVFENPTDSTVGSMPPHSVEVLVNAGPVLSALAMQIFNYVAAGIATTGNQTPVTVTDSQGQAHSIYYSNPVDVPIYVVVNAVVDPATFPANGTQLIINNILGFGGLLPGGDNVVASQLGSSILAGVPALNLLPVPGVLDSGLPYIGTAPSPGSSTTIVIAARDQATFSQGDIAVNITDGSP